MQNILKTSKVSVFGCYGLCGSLFLDSGFDKKQCLKKGGGGGDGEAQKQSRLEWEQK